MRSKTTSNPQAESGRSDHRVYQGVLQPKNFPPLPADWSSEWETFPSSDGILQLFAVHHHKNEWKSPRSLIVIHGMGEHGGRYLHFPHYLKDQLDSVYCLDNRGHGRSEGLRGHVENFSLYADDAALAIARLDETLKKRFGKSEIHLFGHSMGGLIALRTLLTKPDLPICSATISAPMLGVKVEVSGAKKAAALVMSKVWGNLHMNTDIDTSTLSHDPEVAKAYTADRLVHSKATPRWYTESLKAMAETLSSETGIQAPTLFLVPEQDLITDAQKSLAFYRNLKHRDKELKTYPTFFHEAHNELGKEKVFGDIASWIKAHTKQ